MEIFHMGMDYLDYGAVVVEKRERFGMTGSMKMFRVLVFPLFFSAISAFGQSPSPAAPVPKPTPPHNEHWAQMEKYRGDDIKLGSPAPGEKRVVFLGDSITESWRGADFFPGKKYINRGISGQVTTQMLMRFPLDLSDLLRVVF